MCTVVGGMVDIKCKVLGRFNVDLYCSIMESCGSIVGEAPYYMLKGCEFDS